MHKVLSGKNIARDIKLHLLKLIEKHNISPTMLLIQVGSDPASTFYVQNIISNAAKIGCEVRYHELPGDCTQNDLLDLIRSANADSQIDGIMIQKPLPRGFEPNVIDLSISPDKDVDGIHPLNLGKIVNETDLLVPCTAKAVLETLRFYEIDTTAAHAVILGRSTVLGKPLANLLLQKKPFANATVTVCHSKTHDIPRIMRTADILIAAIGNPEYVKADMIKENSILIDVGINLVLDDNGRDKYVGDIDYNSCFDKALAITPVPGGVGSITTSILLQNLVWACLMHTYPNKSIDDFS